LWIRNRADAVVKLYLSVDGEELGVFMCSQWCGRSSGGEKLKQRCCTYRKDERFKMEGASRVTVESGCCSLSWKTAVVQQHL